MGPLREPRVTRFPTAPIHLAILAMLVVSALALLLAPLAVPDDYSWVELTTSSSAAQGVEGAWVARGGFLLLGFAAIVLSARPPERWNRAATALHVLFGVGMIATAAFSEMPWREGVDYDRFEDDLHTIASSVVGFAFIAGLLALVIGALRAQRPPRRFDLLGIAVALGITLALGSFEDVEGVLQRAMFGFAYAWYAREAWSAK